MALSPVSQERRSDPVEFFRAFLQTYFADNDWATTLRLWPTSIANGSAFAEDALWMLDVIVANPSVEPGGFEPPYTHDELVDWLREHAGKLRAEFEKATK